MQPKALALAQVLVLALALASGGPGAAAELGMWAETIPIAEGVPLAGYFKRLRVLPDWLGLDPYSYWFEPSTGTRPDDGIRAKAFVLETPSGQRLVIVSLDTVAVTRGLRRAIVERLTAPTLAGLTAFADGEIVVAATHTHSGPGTLTHNWLMERIGSDRFEEGVRDDFAAAVAAVVQKAWTLRASATLHAFSVAVPGIVRNRSEPEGPLHERANLMLVRSGGGRWVGGLVNFAVHATVLGKDNLLFSADLPGAIERKLQAELTLRNGDDKPTFVAFLNGAEGDVSPKLEGESNLQVLADSFAAPVLGELDTPSCGTPAPCASWAVAADQLAIRRTSFPLREAFVYWKHHVSTPWDSLVWWRFGGWLGWTLWHDTRIAQVQLGDQLLLTWPGEATTRLGRALARAGCTAGARMPWVIGLAEDHLGYFVTEGEFFGSRGIAQKSALYGPYSGRHILSAHCELAGP